MRIFGNPGTLLSAACVFQPVPAPWTVQSRSHALQCSVHAAYRPGEWASPRGVCRCPTQHYCSIRRPAMPLWQPGSCCAAGHTGEHLVLPSNTPRGRKKKRVSLIFLNRQTSCQDGLSRFITSLYFLTCQGDETKVLLQVLDNGKCLAEDTYDFKAQEQQHLNR